MPKEKKPPEPERSAEETATLARDVMKRMLSAPPSPHSEVSGNGKRKSGKGKKRRG
jgi:transposase-like protein